MYDLETIQADILAVMRRLQMETCTIEFSGCGDSGAVDECSATYREQGEPGPDLTRERAKGEQDVRDGLERIACEAFDWCNNEGGMGTATASLLTGQITVTGGQYENQLVEVPPSHYELPLISRERMRAKASADQQSVEAG